MKKILISVAFLTIGGSYLGNAQVGIGTPTPATSSQLDIEATNRGILIPRVELTSTNVFAPIVGSEKESLLVYNINEAADVTNGYYYWFDNKWNRVINSNDLTKATGPKVGDVIYISNGTSMVFQYWDGTAYKTIDFADIVKGNESKTIVVTYNNKQYYLSEKYIQDGGEVDPTKWTSVPANAILIDVIGGIINNFNEFVATKPVTVGSINYTSVQDYIQNLITNSMVNGETRIVINSTTNQASFERWDASAKDWVPVLNSAFKKIVTDNESKTTILEYPANSGKFYYISENAIQANGGTIPTSPFDSNNNLINGVVLLNVPASVVNNFQTILNGTTTINKPNSTTEFYTVAEYIKYLSSTVDGNVVYKNIGDATNPNWVFQYWDGTTYKTIDFKELVKGTESKTVVVTYNNKQYYLSEKYIQDGGEVDPTKWTSVPANAILIDVIGGIINNFNEFVATKPVTVGSINYTSVQDYIQKLIANSMVEGDTRIVIDATTNQASLEKWDATTNKWVPVLNSAFKKIVTDNESKTTILEYPANSGKFYYISENAIQANGGTIPTSPFDSNNNLINGVVLLNVPASVVNNFQTILNGTTTINKPNSTTEFYTVAEYIKYLSSTVDGNVVYKNIGDATNPNWVFQYWDGTTYKTISLTDLIGAAQSKTVLVKTTTPNAAVKQYYLSEAYIVSKTVNGIYTPPSQSDINGWTSSSLPSGVYEIDFVAGVSKNFDTILNQTTTITKPSGGYYTVNEYIAFISSRSLENGVTKIVVDNGLAEFQSWNSTTKQWDDVDNAVFKKIVTDNESNTILRKETQSAITDPIVYKYANENFVKGVNGATESTISITADMVSSITNNLDVQNALNNFLSKGGNVYFTKAEIAANSPAGQTLIPANNFYTIENGLKVKIDLESFVRGLETKTQIKRSEVLTDGTLPAFADSRVAPTNASVKKGDIFYEYNSENSKDYINVTADVLSSITNNDEVKNAITQLINQGGNVYFTKAEIAADIPVGQALIPANNFYTIENGLKVQIKLAELISNLETKTRITRSVSTTDKEVIYSYAHEATKPNSSGAATVGTPDVLNITDDLLYSVTNNTDVIAAIKSLGGNVYFGNHDANSGTADVLYTVINNVNTPIDISESVLQVIANNVANIKNTLGDKISNNTIVTTGDTFNNKPLYLYTTTTEITPNSAKTSGISIPSGKVPSTIIGIKVFNATGLVSNVTDIVIAGQTINFNIGTGNMYNILPAGTYDVIVEFTE